MLTVFSLQTASSMFQRLVSVSLNHILAWNRKRVTPLGQLSYTTQQNRNYFDHHVGPRFGKYSEFPDLLCRPLILILEDDAVSCSFSSRATVPGKSVQANVLSELVHTCSLHQDTVRARCVHTCRELVRASREEYRQPRYGGWTNWTLLSAIFPHYSSPKRRVSATRSSTSPALCLF